MTRGYMVHPAYTLALFPSRWVLLLTMVYFPSICGFWGSYQGSSSLCRSCCPVVGLQLEFLHSLQFQPLAGHGLPRAASSDQQSLSTCPPRRLRDHLHLVPGGREIPSAVPVAGCGASVGFFACFDLGNYTYDPGWLHDLLCFPWLHRAVLCAAVACVTGCSVRRSSNSLRAAAPGLVPVSLLPPLGVPASCCETAVARSSLLNSHLVFMPYHMPAPPTPPSSPTHLRLRTSNPRTSTPCFTAATLSHS